MIPYEKVTRVEVIDANGRSYIEMDAKDVSISLQDDDRTLKIFVGSRTKHLVLAGGDRVRGRWSNREGMVYWSNGGRDETALVWEGNEDRSYEMTDHLEIIELFLREDDRVILEIEDTTYPELAKGDEGTVRDVWADHDEVEIDFDDHLVPIRIEKNKLRRI